MMSKALKYLNTALLVALCIVPMASAESLESDERLKEARAVSNRLISDLGQRLKTEMSTNGPVAAISVCREIAPKIASEASLANGWQVSRVSHRPRNTLIGVADNWEQKALKDFARRIRDGEEGETLEHFEMLDEPLERSFRYIKAIETKPVCLTCHGSSEQIPAPVQERLNSLYPKDRAIGFEVGELRGAVSIKQPMD